MGEFIFSKSELDGVTLISPKQFTSENGSFEKNYERIIYESNGILFEITEEYKLISDKGVLRGIHFQNPEPQSRIISVLMGEALVAVVDLRKDSAQVGKWKTYRINNQNKISILAPKGFGVGTLTLQDQTVIEVKCSGQYYGENSLGIRYDDEELNIDWKEGGIENIKVSEKDKKQMSFREYMQQDVSC